ncbi:MbnP family protein [Gilvibacter sp.]|uniref:MbnP family protein n=1 Tax=Gilvibacter sp. TaxID=2729997 RepID=UPI0025C185A4|nr:MbnP family protein [Gilvibacter sp.]NQX76410.1 hypothetical protein [Gilvibacter sp.]
MKKIFLLTFAVAALISCKSDDNQAAPGEVNLVFKNQVAGNDLILSSQTYTNASGESYRVNELKYIISDIVLIGSNGQEFVVPQSESYFVVNEADNGSKTLSIPEVEGRKYSKIRFGFGVDQSNYPLNGVNNFIPTAEETGMLWSWSAGYKFIKFEGDYDTDTSTDAPFIIHVGSHGTTLDNYKTIELDLSTDISVNDNTNNVNLIFDVARVFDAGLQSFSLQEKDDIQVDPVYAPIIASNISTAFSTE